MMYRQMVSKLIAIGNTDNHYPVERRWIVGSDELTNKFPDLPDIGYCTMNGDGDAIPPWREWPKKFLKKGFPMDSIPNYNSKCPRRAVTRWCHIKVAVNANRTGTTPIHIEKYVDTCEGHHRAFSIPAPPSLGRGPGLEVGEWKQVSFGSY